MSEHMSHPIAEAYKGFILAERERNMTNDSYFLVTVWNPDTAQPEEFEYAATAYGGIGPMQYETVMAAIAETPDSIKAAYSQWQLDRSRSAEAWSLAYRMEQAMFGHHEVFKGATVKVTRGRKVPRGTTGVILTTSTRVFGWNNERQYLMLDCGDKVLTVDSANVDVVAHSPAKLQELFDLAEAA